MCSCAVFALRWPQFFFPPPVAAAIGWHGFSTIGYTPELGSTESDCWTASRNSDCHSSLRNFRRRARGRLVSGWKQLSDTNYQFTGAVPTDRERPMTTRATAETPVRIFSRILSLSLSASVANFYPELAGLQIVTLVSGENSTWSLSPRAQLRQTPRSYCNRQLTITKRNCPINYSPSQDFLLNSFLPGRNEFSSFEFSSCLWRFQSDSFVYNVWKTFRKRFWIFPR